LIQQTMCINYPLAASKIMPEITIVPPYWPPVNLTNCVIISVTENGIVASEMVLPKRRLGDATQHTGIRGSG